MELKDATADNVALRRELAAANSKVCTPYQNLNKLKYVVQQLEVLSTYLSTQKLHVWSSCHHSSSCMHTDV
jgi:hypothetical protein